MSKNICVFDDNGEIIGWISKGGCSHPRCKRAMKDGLMFHATPRARRDEHGEIQYYQLPTYHYMTQTQASEAIRNAEKV